MGHDGRIAGWRRVAVVLVATLIVALGGAVPSLPPAGADAPPSAPVPGGRLVPRTCDTKQAVPTRCYWLEVPERRDVANARTLKLWVAVFTPVGTPEGATPYLRLTGGPGDPASSPWVAGRVAPVGGKPHPIVVIDQRGTGRSTPRPTCRGLEQVIDTQLRWSVQLAQVRAQAETCAAQLREQGFDLDGYDTIENAADLVALRHGLGYRHWIVYGLSYGGRLAAELYRQDPAAVVRLHLDSPITSGHLGAASLKARAEAAIQRVATACAAVVSCAADGPLLANVEAAYRRLEAKPYKAVLPDGTTRVIDGDTLMSGAFQLLYRTELIPLLPVAAKALAGGDTSILSALAAQLVPSFVGVDTSNPAIQSLIDCSDDGPATKADAAALADPGRWRALLGSTDQVCERWGLAGVPGGRLPRPSGPVPTLLTEGQFDPIAPVTFFGGTITRQFPNTSVAIVRGSGHVVTFDNACISSIATAFTDGRDRPPKACLSKLPVAFTG